MKCDSRQFYVFSFFASVIFHGVVLCGLLSFASVYKAPENGLAQGTVSSMEKSEMILLETSSAPESPQEKYQAFTTTPSSALCKNRETKQAASRKESQACSGLLGSRDAMPSYLHNPQPSYPASEQQSGHEGVVLLHVVVSVTGKVMKVTLEKSSGYPLLDERAKATVESCWRFGPAMLNQKAIASEILIPIHFSLRKN